MYSPIRITCGRAPGNQRRGVAQDVVEPVEKFLRQAEPRVPGAAALDLPGDEIASQPGSMRESSPSGARCTSAMVAPICASTRSF